MEHARAVEQLGQTEATRQGEQLRTALLDAVTHALRTPLTSIKASVTNLLSNPGLIDGQKQELLVIINEEADRLNRLVGEAAEMARLDAGEVKLELEPHPIEDVIQATLEHCKGPLGNRTVNVRICSGASSRPSGCRTRSGGACSSGRKCESVLAARSADHDHSRSQRRLRPYERGRPRIRN